MAFVHWIVPSLFKTSASDVHKEILPKYMKILEKYKK